MAAATHLDHIQAASGDAPVRVFHVLERRLATQLAA